MYPIHFLLSSSYKNSTSQGIAFTSNVSNTFSWRQFLGDLNTLCLITYSIVLCYDVYLDVYMYYVSVVYFFVLLLLEQKPNACAWNKSVTEFWFSPKSVQHGVWKKSHSNFHSNDLNVNVSNKLVFQKYAFLDFRAKIARILAQKFKWDFFELFLDTVFSFTMYRNWVRTENCSVQDNFFPWQVTFRSDPYL